MQKRTSPWATTGAAAERARWATQQDAANAKGWFIQVVAALKLRDVAASQMNRHHVEAHRDGRADVGP